MKILDLKKELKYRYRPSVKKAESAQGPRLQFAMIDGKHHEIYLGDPRKANPARLKTVLRHPIEKVNRI